MAMASATRVQLSKSLPDLVREIVSRTCGRMEISEQYRLAFDLGLDDADRAELLMAVELALCVDFSVSEAARYLRSANSLMLPGVKPVPRIKPLAMTMFALDR